MVDLLEIFEFEGPERRKKRPGERGGIRGLLDRLRGNEPHGYRDYDERDRRYRSARDDDDGYDDRRRDRPREYHAYYDDDDDDDRYERRRDRDDHDYQYSDRARPRKKKRDFEFFDFGD